MRERRRRSWTIAAAAVWAGAALFAPGRPALCQPEETMISPTAPQNPPAIDPLDITGRDFAGIRLAPAPVAAAAELSADLARVWTETDANGQPVQRLLLEGDVTVRLGLYRFVAARAVAWIQQTPEAGGAAGGEDGAAVTRQIAVYFDRVSDPGAEAGVGQTADRLLVTGVLTGELTLRVDVTERGRPEGGRGGAFVQEAEARLTRFLLRQIGAVEFVQGAPEDVFTRAQRAERERFRPGQAQPYEPGSDLAPSAPPPERRAVLDPALRLPPIFADKGTIVFAAERAEFARGDEANTLIITGGLTAQHIDPMRDRTLQISAQRAVVFTAPGSVPEVLQYQAEDVYGIYLEGDVVATNGTYTLRGKQVYYNVRENTAYIADAVFFTYDEEHRVPLYVRARAMRQEAENRFSAEGATLSNASFADPQFAIGANQITVTRERRPVDGGIASKTIVDARGLTLKGMGVPFFYWPHFKGDTDDIPLKDVSVENSSGSGTAIKTAWDVFGLLGMRPPAGVAANLLLDGYFKRGVAVGTDTSWFTGDSAGSVLAYLLPSDSGTDQLTSGAEIERDDETRSLVIAEHRWALDDRWTLFLEGAFASDENVVDAFFEPLAETRREFTNSAYLRYLDDGSALTLQGKGSIMDFTPNEYLLQSQGYDVEKLPEIAYWRFADDLLGDAAPGAVTYSSETRYSRARINMTEPTAEELGFDTDKRAQAAFGINPHDSLADRLRLMGIHSDEVNRFDTRHELSSAFYLGPVKVNPFVTGRITAYDETFDDFSPQDNADDHARYFGAAGTRLSTSITHVNNDFESRLFDLHRVRHIVEPNVTVWTSGANLDQETLPIYDDRVESLATGSAVRVGVDQTWQTMRGSPGRYRSVDFLTIRQHFTFSSQDADRESPIGRFFDFRPEYSLLGDYSTTDVVWNVSDPVALSFNMVYDLETHQPARTSAGALVQHSDAFSSYIEARYINALDSTYLNFGADYRLTRKYSLEGHATYDTDFDEFQSISGVVRRRFPEATLGAVVNFNQITDETSFGFVFEPVGVTEEPGARLRRLGSDRGRVRAVGG
jgi:hypothetical protein